MALALLEPLPGADLLDEKLPLRPGWEPLRSEVQRLRDILQLLEVDALLWVLSFEEVRKRPSEERLPESS